MLRDVFDTFCDLAHDCPPMVALICVGIGVSVARALQVIFWLAQ